MPGAVPQAKLRVKLPLLGNHQQVNAAVAIGALRVLQEVGIRVSREAILEGLENVSWPGRLEVINRRPRGRGRWRP